MTCRFFKHTLPVNRISDSRRGHGDRRGFGLIQIRVGTTYAWLPGFVFSDSKTRSRFLYHTPADVADSRYQPPEGRLSSGPEAEPVRDVFLNKDTFRIGDIRVDVAKIRNIHGIKASGSDEPEAVSHHSGLHSRHRSFLSRGSSFSGMSMTGSDILLAPSSSA